MGIRRAQFEGVEIDTPRGRQRVAGIQEPLPGTGGESYAMSGRYHEPEDNAALAKRVAKRDQNRETMGQWGRVGDPVLRNVTPHPTSNYGVPEDKAGLFARGAVGVNPFSYGAFRRVGRYEEIPNTADVRSLQGSYAPGRVQQLVDDPSTGKSPRLPAEHPMVARTSPSPGAEPVNSIVQGNHRFMASRARNEMFQPARVIDYTQPGAQQNVQSYQLSLAHKKKSANKKARRRQGQA